MTAPLVHRRDIDGLRAVAVLPVLLYHAGIPGFSGGFVGVDVFFVISGYLIARLIVSDLDGEGFSLLRFYERRARRILPALLLMILACVLAGALLLLPNTYKDFSESVLATLGFFSNVHFFRDTGYFAPEAITEPLLHTWSLAVEEQFYFVFPLLLMAVGKGRKRLRLGLCLVLLIVSLALCVLQTEQNADAAFYLGHTRAWELLLGALLAFGALPAPGSIQLRHAMSLLGLAMILGAVVGFDHATAFPGWWALLPCVGAALVLLAGSGEAPVGLGTRLLGTIPAVAVGQVSYSLYLWHWPLLVFLAAWLGRAPAPGAALAALAGSGLLAYLSWRFVEQPFRRSKPRMRLRRVIASLAGGAGLLAAMAVLIASTQGLPQRLPAEARGYLAAKNDVMVQSGDCFGQLPGDEHPPCSLGVTDRPVRLLLWGDSHGAVFGEAVDALAREADLAGVALVASACPPGVGVERTGVSEDRNCLEAGRRILDFIDRTDLRIVILHARWALYVEGSRLPGEGGGPLTFPSGDNRATVAHGLEQLLDRLAKRGIAIVLVASVPEAGFDVPMELARRVLRGEPIGGLTRSVVDARQQQAFALLQELATRYGALLVDPRAAFCHDDTCDLARDGQSLYHDDDHLSLAGVAALAPLLTPLELLLRQVAQAP